MKRYFYKLLHRYLSLYIREKDVCIEIKPKNNLLSTFFKNSNYYTVDGTNVEIIKTIKEINPDYVVLNGTLHYEKDIQLLLKKINEAVEPRCRVIICYYSGLWRPLIRLASLLGLRQKNLPELNWFSPADLQNFAVLSDLEVVQHQERILLPIPYISGFLNRFIAPLPFFRLFTMLNISVLRPKSKPEFQTPPSVSIVIPARNEEGNIQEIVRRIPVFCNDIELIFVEGNSTDNTWEEIQKIPDSLFPFKIIRAKQEGKGKGDAVRKGFSLATKDVLMILDADMTVPPESLPKFYDAIKEGKGEFINGSRLVYPLENESMRFFNILGNKFFASAFSFVLRQRFKDTLCGTKVLSRRNYLKLAENRTFFGDFDPFGDFDLLFGASRLGLKIVEIPINYKARTYGNTNISRWKHGWLLLKMLIFAARKIKFI